MISVHDTYECKQAIFWTFHENHVDLKVLFWPLQHSEMHKKAEEHEESEDHKINQIPGIVGSMLSYVGLGGGDGSNTNNAVCFPLNLVQQPTDSLLCQYFFAVMKPLIKVIEDSFSISIKQQPPIVLEGEEEETDPASVDDSENRRAGQHDWCRQPAWHYSLRHSIWPR